MSSGRRLIPGLICGAALFLAYAHTQAQRGTDAENTLADAFKGVTTDGKVVPSLYSIRHTGLSTAGVRHAAQAFLDSLTEEQRRKTAFAFDSNEWRTWSNVPSPPHPPRAGVLIDELTDAQRARAFALISAGLSAKGAKQVEDIMKLNATLFEITQDKRFGRFFYALTVMGTPSETEPWGWQLDGHHMVINYFVLGDQVVMTPTFFGAEPVRATLGPFVGTVVLQAEQDKGFGLLTALTPAQRTKATIAMEKGSQNNIAAAYRDNLVLDYTGIRASELDGKQRSLLVDLIADHLDNLPAGHDKLRMEEVNRHLDGTYFAWIGGTDPGGVFYYRIQSPVILIEFDHQAPARFATQPATRDHIHTLVRTPNGNDYGKDLLRQHYAQHPHPASTGGN